jgi:hypothetical protein
MRLICVLDSMGDHDVETAVIVQVGEGCVLSVGNITGVICVPWGMPGFVAPAECYPYASVELVVGDLVITAIIIHVCGT